MITLTGESPWYVVNAGSKKSARLNVISHLLTQVPYEKLPSEKVELPPRQQRSYARPPVDAQNWIPLRYAVK